MAFGAGSEVAHQGVRAMMGGSSSGHAEAAPEAPQQQQADPTTTGQDSGEFPNDYDNQTMHAEACGSDGVAPNPEGI